MKQKKMLVVLAFLISVGSAAIGEFDIKVGDSMDHVVNSLGAPLGKAKAGSQTIYIYDGGNIVFKNGKAVEVPKNYEASAQQKKKEREAYEQQKAAQRQFAVQQRAKGFVWYDSQWMTTEQRALKKAKERERLLAMAEEAKEQKRVAAEAAKQKRLASAPKLLLLNWNLSHDKDGTRFVEGSVKNISSEVIKNAIATAHLYLYSGKFFAANEALLELNPLLPNQISSFYIHFPDREGYRCEMSFKTLSGKTLRHKIEE